MLFVPTVFRAAHLGYLALPPSSITEAEATAPRTPGQGRQGGAVEADSCRFHRLLPPTFPASPASPLKPVVGGPHRTFTELLVTNGSGLTLSQPTQPSCLGSFLKTSFLRPWEPQAPGVRPAPPCGSDTQRGRGWLNIMRTLAQARPGRRPGCVTVTGADSPVVGQTPLNYRL